MNKENNIWLQNVWNKLEIKMKTECKRIGFAIPYIPADGRYKDMGRENIAWWTNGFWPGILWQMYAATGDDLYKETAQAAETRLEQSLNDFVKLDHDVGFLWMLSAVADYRMTGNHKSHLSGLRAANILTGRFNPAGAFIRAWGSEAKDERYGYMIIDCLMNLSLLYWASEETGDPRYKNIAVNHTDTTIKHLLRPDGSAYHIVNIDAGTGERISYPQSQGYEPASSWSRGQAWAIYGMTLAAKHTGNPVYLDIAKNCAHYFMACISASGYVPLCDFRAPKEPVIYDTSAGACAACGLLELSKLVTEGERGIYEEAAMKIVKALDQTHCNWNANEDGLLLHGCVAYHSNQTDVPLIYGDYFYVEAITKLLGKGGFLW